MGFLHHKQQAVLMSGLWADNERQSYPTTAKRDRVLAFLSDVVERLRPDSGSAFPGWITFKGSDTAYECLSRVLMVRGFYYLGPIVSGALLCKIADSNSPWFDTPFILFAGNSGEPNSLYDLSEKMRAAAAG